MYQSERVILINSSDATPHYLLLILMSNSAAYLVALLQYNLKTYFATH